MYIHVENLYILWAKISKSTHWHMSREWSGLLQRVAACCIALHCVAVCRIALKFGGQERIQFLEFQYGSISNGLLQCVAVYCSVLQCIAACCSVLQRAAVCGSVLKCVAVCCSVLQCVAVCCSVLQCVAVCCSYIRNDACPFWQTRCIYRQKRCIYRQKSPAFWRKRHIHDRVKFSESRDLAWPKWKKVFSCWRLLKKLWTTSSMPLFTAVLTGVLHCGALCCSVLQCVNASLSSCMLQRVAACCSITDTDEWVSHRHRWMRRVAHRNDTHTHTHTHTQGCGGIRCIVLISDVLSPKPLSESEHMHTQIHTITHTHKHTYRWDIFMYFAPNSRLHRHRNFK